MKDHELDALLRTATGGFPVAAGFQRKVWSRIETESPKPGLLHGVLDWLARPLGMATGVAAMAALGLLLGAASVPSPTGDRLSYVEAISPFMHPGEP